MPRSRRGLLESLDRESLWSLADSESSHTAASRYYALPVFYLCGSSTLSASYRLYFAEEEALLVVAETRGAENIPVVYPVYPGSSMFNGDSPFKRDAVETYCRFVFACLDGRLPDIAARITAARTQAMETR